MIVSVEGNQTMMQSCSGSATSTASVTVAVALFTALWLLMRLAIALFPEHFNLAVSIFLSEFNGLSLIWRYG